VWCLRHDLATNIASGNAIEIATNNVTIDCNDFKVGGLAAGEASQTAGIYANARQNATVRHCNVRGFYKGIYLNGGGHLVEDNRLDNNLYSGITVEGDNGLVRGNRVFDTGGSTFSTGDAIGISATADVVDNIVDGVFTAGITNEVAGISVGTSGTQVSGNVVSRLALAGGVGTAYGVELNGSNVVTVSRNRIAAGASALNGTGIKGSDATFCIGNTVANFSAAMTSCLTTDPDNNLVH
jgi:parallel beta-helix repeat protein